MSLQGTDERLVTAGELAEYLGLSKAAVLDRFQSGELPGFRLYGRKGGPVRFRLSEVVAQLESWRVGPTPLSVAAAGPSLPSLEVV